MVFSKKWKNFTLKKKVIFCFQEKTKKKKQKINKTDIRRNLLICSCGNYLGHFCTMAFTVPEII